MSENLSVEYSAPRPIYRRTEQIRDDIINLKAKIEEINSSLSIRELLVDLLNDSREKKASEWIYDLEALLGEAESAYRKLGRLKEELYFLEAELGEAKCVMRL